MKISINYLGDFCPIGRFERDDILDDQSWIGGLLPILRGADINILNLECPLTTSCIPIKKSGPNLKAHPRTVKLLKDMNVDVVCLANNHIMDFGTEGLRNTIDVLERSGIKYVGAGMNIDEARLTLYVEKRGIKLAFINVCEKEFSIAGQLTAGAAPLDIISTYYSIKEAKKKADQVILLIHGGLEYYSHPTPRQVQQYRFYASLGVSAVIGHHSHCVQDWEFYQGTPIMYSLGNFIFDDVDITDGWNRGLMLSHSIDETNKVDLNVTSFEVDYGVLPQLKICDVTSYKQTDELDENAVIQKWTKHVGETRKLCNRLNSIQKNGMIKRFVYKIYPKTLLRKIDMPLLNLIRNETHHEYLVSALESHLHETLVDND